MTLLNGLEGLALDGDGGASLALLGDKPEHLEGCACGECAAIVGDKAPGPGGGAADDAPANGSSPAQVPDGG